MQYIFYNTRNINMIGCVFFVNAWTITRFLRGKTLFHLSHLRTLFFVSACIDSRLSTISSSR